MNDGRKDGGGEETGGNWTVIRLSTHFPNLLSTPHCQGRISELSPSRLPFRSVHVRLTLGSLGVPRHSPPERSRRRSERRVKVRGTDRGWRRNGKGSGSDEPIVSPSLHLITSAVRFTCLGFLVHLRPLESHASYSRRPSSVSAVPSLISFLSPVPFLVTLVRSTRLIPTSLSSSSLSLVVPRYVHEE